MSTLAIIIQYIFESPNCGSQKRKRNKRNPKELKWSLYADDMIVYIENLKDTAAAAAAAKSLQSCRTMCGPRYYQKTIRGHQ